MPIPMGSSTHRENGVETAVGTAVASVAVEDTAMVRARIFPQPTRMDNTPPMPPILAVKIRLPRARRPMVDTSRLRSLMRTEEEATSGMPVRHLHGTGPTETAMPPSLPTATT